MAVVETSFVCEPWSMEKKSRAPDRSLIQVILQKYRDCSVDSITGPTGIRKYEPSRGSSHYHQQHHHRAWPSTVADGVPVKSKQEHVTSSKERDRDGPPSFAALGSARLPASGVAASTPKKPLKVRRTLLDGIPLACFNVGGEKRLCFGQLLAEVLKEFSVSEVNASRDHLKIYCPRCDEHQLESLKLSEDVAWSVSSSLLITKSDAYRLCSDLLSNRAPQRQDKKYAKPYLNVYHECFGGCKGIFETEAYNEPHAKCVTCLECLRLFSPRKFATHSHAKTEIQTCHWGMDSSKWRLYVLLPDDKAEDEATKKLWEDVKKRFAGTPLRKRKQSNSEGESLAADSDSGESHSKKRLETGGVSSSSIATTKQVLPCSGSRSGTPSSSMSAPREHNEHGNNNRRSAFRPWSPLEEKPRVEGASTCSSETNSPSHMNSRFFHPPPPLPFLARNCSCPVSYNPLNGAINFAHPSLGKAVKTEYPNVICAQGMAVNNTSSNNNSRETTASLSRHNITETLPQAAREDQEPDENTSTTAATTRGDEKTDENFSAASEQNFASPERVKQVLHKYCHKGHLPSVEELSFALAKELREWSRGQERVLDEVNERGEKIREEMNCLRRANDSKLEAARGELKCCQERVELLNRKREEDLKEFAKTREALQRQVENLQEQRSSESDTVKKLMSQLGERETRCRLLEKELDYIRSWYIGSQRRFPAFQPVAVYGAPNLRDLYCTQSAVIQEIPIFSRNGDAVLPLGNRSGKNEESERETNAEANSNKERASPNSKKEADS